MSSKISQNCIIDLLTALKAVKPENIEEASKTAKKLSISFERAITMLNFISSESFNPILKIAELVDRNLISRAVAIEAYKLFKHEGMSIDEALDKVKNDPKFQEAELKKQVSLPDNEFIHVLLNNHLATKDQLMLVMQKAQKGQINLTKALILDRYLTKSTINTIFSLINYKKELNLSDDFLSKCLRTAHSRQITCEQVLFEQGIKFPNTGTSLKLHELIYMSKLINEAELIECLEIEISQNINFANILTHYDFINAKALESAYSLLDMVASPTIRPYHAAQAMFAIKHKNISTYQALAELKTPPQIDKKPYSFYEILSICKVVTSDDLTRSNASIDDNGVGLGKKLLHNNAINEVNLNTALRAYSLHKEGALNHDDATNLLNTANQYKITIDEAVLRLGYQIPLRMQWNWI